MTRIADKLTAHSCITYMQAFSAVSWTQYIIWEALSGLFACALCRNRMLATQVCLCGVAPAIIDFTQLHDNLTGIILLIS
ncbi:hypothetical protein BD309DRAFT_303146 [Dichomitus squalens]|nr:hypothetical protein BD309DRAFT_303146 [Dichomitus squalens]